MSFVKLPLDPVVIMSDVIVVRPCANDVVLFIIMSVTLEDFHFVVLSKLLFLCRSVVGIMNRHRATMTSDPSQP